LTICVAVRAVDLRDLRAEAVDLALLLVVEAPRGS
jgi:hypothetical protein